MAGRKRKYSLVMLALLTSSPIVGASDWGSLSCQHWMNTHETPPKAAGGLTSYSESAILHWATGYVAGLTDANGSYVDVDPVKLTKWLEGYCSNRPTDSVSDAARAFVSSVARRTK
ncbi:hypothetical protein PPN31114_00222 [Pandoraea pneumonica]|uniref:Rap1a immunity protein domain-containing protein n=1 Tax=Pandoraea pneumonica TaxID=2508299 RepID=A0A5E4RN28_9BURK|nr:hypothetical protein PPN31114_00222 [Pandoraea pneumonica]